MSKRTASIISELLFLAVALFFFIGSFYIVGSGSAYESPTYYPRLISGIMAVLSLISLYRDLFGDLKHVRDVIPIAKKRNLLIVFLCIVALTVLWSRFGLIYLWLFLVLSVLQFALNPVPLTGKHIVKTLIVSAVYSLTIYLVFVVMFSIKL